MAGGGSWQEEWNRASRAILRMFRAEQGSRSGHRGHSDLRRPEQQQQQAAGEGADGETVNMAAGDGVAPTQGYEDGPPPHESSSPAQPEDDHEIVREAAVKRSS